MKSSSESSSSSLSLSLSLKRARVFFMSKKRLEGNFEIQSSVSKFRVLNETLNDTATPSDERSTHSSDAATQRQRQTDRQRRSERTMTAARMATSSSLCSGGRGGGFFCRRATTTTFTRAKGLRRRDVDATASSTSSSSSEEDDNKNNNSKAIKKETTTETETIFFTVEVETIVARRAIQWDSLAIGDENRAIFVSGVAFDSEAERKGIKPGMRLVAITDPVDKAEMWQIPKNVTFVRAMDAIRSTRAYDIQLTFEKEASITREMVEYAKALRAGDEEEEERKQIEEDEIRRAMMTSSSSSSPSSSSSSVAPPSTKPPSKARIPRPSQGEKERPDLYSDKWQGDEYVGTGPWNELTVGLAIAVAVPLLITIVAAATNGVLWNVPDSVNRYR